MVNRSGRHRTSLEGADLGACLATQRGTDVRGSAVYGPSVLTSLATKLNVLLAVEPSATDGGDADHNYQGQHDARTRRL